MSLYYFDIETTGIEPGINMVVTIQYARLTKDFEPAMDLEVLGVWEFKSERELIKKFLEDSKFFEDNFAFVPVGVNLIYDILFIYTRAKHYKLVNKPFIDILRSKPFIDLKPILVIINRGEFREFTKFVGRYKQTEIRGNDVPTLYARKDYDSIVKYVKDEYQAVLEVLKQIKKALERLQLQ